VSAASRTTAGSADAAWVGIGGVRSEDLIQAGTEAEVSARGQVEYTAWIETLPSSSQTIDLTVHAGDVIAVTITEQSADNWQITITNKTTGQSYQTTVHYQSSHSSAEWIEEAPSTGSARSQVVPLDNFGSITFSNGSATEGGKQETIAETGATPITMYGRTGNIATTSDLTSSGSGFTVTRVGS
jgi:hypothetical protein